MSNKSEVNILDTELSFSHMDEAMDEAMDGFEIDISDSIESDMQVDLTADLVDVTTNTNNTNNLSNDSAEFVLEPNPSQLDVATNPTEDTLDNSSKESIEKEEHKILVLITHDPSHSLASLAFRYVESALTQVDNQLSEEQANKNLHVEVFFYTDGASTANRLRWQSADQVNLTTKWQALAKQYDLALNVCVSTAMARGVMNDNNAKRHDLLKDGLTANNLAEGFYLVGLSELVMKMSDHQLIQF